MVFQFGNLVPELTLLENVMLPLRLQGSRAPVARSRALAVLGQLGVADVSGRPAGAVSGGQVQRAAEWRSRGPNRCVRTMGWCRTAASRCCCC
jgi:putative ABC transport system ATP-binding protein